MARQLGFVCATDRRAGGPPFPLFLCLTKTVGAPSFRVFCERVGFHPVRGMTPDFIHKKRLSVQGETSVSATTLAFARRDRRGAKPAESCRKSAKNDYFLSAEGLRAASRAHIAGVGG